MTSGLTGIHDSSYSILNEYKKNIKDRPDITIAVAPVSADVVLRKNIVYSKTDKRDLLMDAFYPSFKTKKKRIPIVFIHGGGWRSGDRFMHYQLARKLADLGYVCFLPEYRLSTEALYPAPIEDIQAAIKWLKKNAGLFNLDTNKVVIAGHSAGGELAAFIGSKNEKEHHVNAVIDIDGTLAFVHPESGEGDDSKKISAATYWFGYSKTENPELWKDAAPLSHVNEGSAPILFINSSVARMHAGRDDYIKLLKQYDIYSEVKTMYGAPHTFCFFNPWFDPMIETMDTFIKKVFK